MTRPPLRCATRSSWARARSTRTTACPPPPRARACSTRSPSFAACEPGLFSERGLVNLERLASDDARALDPDPQAAQIAVPAPPVDDEDPWAALGEEGFTITRRVSRHPLTWLDAYTRALDALGVPVAEARQAA